MSSTMNLDEFRSKARNWCQENLPKKSATFGVRDEDDTTFQNLEADRELRRKMYAAGFVGITIPVEYGGQGLTKEYKEVWAQESAEYAVPMPGGVASNVSIEIVVPTILAHGTEEQKREWVPRLLSSDDLWVQLLSEPGAGSDLAGVLTKAERDGDSWVITGSKVWSSGALCSDYGLLLARTDWDAPKHSGLTWFKIPLKHSHVTVRPIREINGSAEFCEEFIDGLVVSDDCRIGGLNDGWTVANSILAFERGSEGLGIAIKQVGRRPLAPDLVALARHHGTITDGGVRQLIAKAHIDDYMYDKLTERLSVGMQAKIMNPLIASYIKLARGVLEPQRVNIAMEIAGHRGIAWKSDDAEARVTSTNFLNGRIWAIAGGSNQIQRNIISERVLGLPREPGFDTGKPFRQVLEDAKTWGSKNPNK